MDRLQRGQSGDHGADMNLRKPMLIAAGILIVIVGYFGWKLLQPSSLPNGMASSNGRIEAIDIDIATKTPGRLVSVLVNEGDFVVAGQVLAQMDTDVLKAQLREAEAELRHTKAAVETALSVVAQRESEKTAAEAVVAQRQAEMDLASRNFARAESLLSRADLSKEDFDTTRAALFGAKAAVSSAKAHVAGAQAAIATAKSQVISSEASVGAAQAKIERLQVDINETTLKAPREGRVQFRIAEPGEVLNAGGKVLNMVDLTDVYMTFFLPTGAAGLVQIGAEVRLVLDAAPKFVIPARVSYVADVAQFTPRTVETTEEREKLMFRIKAKIDPQLLKKHVRSVKTGVPGMAYIRLDENIAWPARLEVHVPQ